MTLQFLLYKLVVYSILYIMYTIYFYLHIIFIVSQKLFLFDFVSGAYFCDTMAISNHYESDVRGTLKTLSVKFCHSMSQTK